MTKQFTAQELSQWFNACQLAIRQNYYGAGKPYPKIDRNYKIDTTASKMRVEFQDTETCRYHTYTLTFNH